MKDYNTESLLEMYLFESEQLMAQLEAVILACERSRCFTSESIAEIFRNMHTLKGSAAMMQFMSISNVAHGIEDLFYCLREHAGSLPDFDELLGLILDGLDFIKLETLKVRHGDPADGDSRQFTIAIERYLKRLSEVQKEASYDVTVLFVEGCQMENIRAYHVLRQLAEVGLEVSLYEPRDILENEQTEAVIRERGFKLTIQSPLPQQYITDCLSSMPNVREVQLAAREETAGQEAAAEQTEHPQERRETTVHQSMISVHVGKLDQLMNLVGELVIAEAMVTQHEELKGLSDQFQKSAVHLRKITGELQDIIMSIRMVPLATTFHKMHRVVRDMGKKLQKEVDIHIIGEETEVDKHIIEHISDPLMHLVRNAIDHGLEPGKERLEAGKPSCGTLTLEARNAGNDVIISVTDDGRGLDKDKIWCRAMQQGLVSGEQDALSDREMYNLVFLPGFSTKENVTEFSGRGVGMDVAFKNIEMIGGTIVVDSTKGEGTSISLKIPLTLAIIDGMNIRVGQSRYTIPITAIQESFKPRREALLKDPDGNEMIMVRGDCYPIMRLSSLLNKSEETCEAFDLTNGVLVVVEQDGRRLCLLVDELLGQQQVVVKSLPAYIRNLKRIEGLAGCTLLGDGSISLILDVPGLMGPAARRSEI